MADPLSITSGIAGLLTLTISLADVSYQYVSSVQDASKSIKAYLRELSALKAVLFKLNELLLESIHSGVFTASQSSLLTMISIDECRKDLHQITNKLETRSKQTVLNTLTWPFAEKDTEKHVKAIRRHHDLFHMALSADALLVVHIAVSNRVGLIEQVL